MLEPRPEVWDVTPNGTCGHDQRHRTRQHQRVIEQIAALGPVLPGSLVTRSSRCGNPNCHCHTDPTKMHGPYLTWTRSVGGKTITRALTPDQADRARAWFDNAQRLRELTDELKRLGIEHAQTDEHWPAT